MSEEQLLCELKHRKQQVEYLLEKYPATRDNDLYLQIMWLKIFGKLSVKIPFVPWEELSALGGAMEGVRRVRQKIQNEENRYLPSSLVQSKRNRRQRNMRKVIKKI